MFGAAFVTVTVPELSDVEIPVPPEMFIVAPLVIVPDPASADTIQAVVVPVLVVYPELLVH